MKHYLTDCRTLSCLTAFVLTLLSSCTQRKSDATGVFEAPSTTISAETDGKLVLISAEEGDIVETGQEMAICDTVRFDIQLRQLASQLKTVNAAMADSYTQTEALRARLEQLKKEQRRTEKLLAAGAATPQQRDQLDGSVMMVEGQIRALEENVRNTNRASEGSAESILIEMESVRDILKRCHICSPCHGTVTARYVETGEVAVAGRPLFKVVDTDRMFLRAYFSGSLLTSLRIGQKVKVRTMFGGNEREYDGTVTWISEESEFTPKSILAGDERSNLVYAVKIAVENDGYLKTGLYGEVWL